MNICFFTFWLYWMSLASLEKLTSLFSILRKYKKGDTFDEEFYVEEVNLNGTIKSSNLEKDTYTFISKFPKDQNSSSQFNINNMENLYEDIIKQEDKEFEEFRPIS